MAVFILGILFAIINAVTVEVFGSQAVFAVGLLYNIATSSKLFNF